MMIRI
jgi:hypothetical protein